MMTIAVIMPLSGSGASKTDGIAEVYVKIS
jgi:hypothetical protein